MPASTWPITTRLMCVFSFTCDAGRARSRINAPHAGFRVFACLRGCCDGRWQSLRLPQRPRGRKRRHRRHGGYLVIARPYRLPRCDFARRLAPYRWEQLLGWRDTLLTHHGCCMQAIGSMADYRGRFTATGFVTIKNSSRGPGGRLTRLGSVAWPVVFIMRLSWRLKNQARSP